jgi:single-strand DNA-binding protein
VVLWGRQGEVLNQYLVKGKAVTVDGELRQDRWEQDGQNRSKIEIVASTIVLGGSPGQGTASPGPFSGDNSQRTTPSRQAGPEQPEQETPPDDGFADDIPF